jgi:NADP-dependent 3-hydroxy acid dehydrogenase YdfG
VNTGLKDRVILVTGASGGIGAATVRMLIKEEAKVIASGRNEDKLTELATETGCDVLPFDLAVRAFREKLHYQKLRSMVS